MKEAIEQEKSLEAALSATTNKEGRINAELLSTRAKIDSLKAWIRAHAAELD